MKLRGFKPNANPLTFRNFGGVPFSLFTMGASRFYTFLFHVLEENDNSILYEFSAPNTIQGDEFGMLMEYVTNLRSRRDSKRHKRLLKWTENCY